MRKICFLAAQTDAPNIYDRLKHCAVPLQSTIYDINYRTFLPLLKRFFSHRRLPSSLTLPDIALIRCNGKWHHGIYDAWFIYLCFNWILRACEIVGSCCWPLNTRCDRFAESKNHNLQIEGRRSLALMNAKWKVSGWMIDFETVGTLCSRWVWWKMEHRDDMTLKDTSVMKWVGKFGDLTFFVIQRHQKG